jgi:carbamoyltransferase
MLILGLSDLGHDTAAALLDGPRPAAAVEEDKLSRSPASAGIPHLAIQSCLRQCGARISDLAIAGIACRPRRAWLRDEGGQLTTFVAPFRNRYGEDITQTLFRKLNEVRGLRASLGPQIPLLNFEHHLAHAASAFYPSGFDRALVLTLDQCGDMWSGTVALGEGTALRILRPLRFPNSLGWFYSRITELLGFRPGKDEHKVQWLSKEGAPEFVSVFRKLFRKGADRFPVLDLQHVVADQAGHFSFSPEIRRQLQLSTGPPAKGSPLAASIARSAQQFLEETVVELAETFRQKTGTKNLCVAGGVFLNVLLVRALERCTGFAAVFAQPAAGNAGSALGAAYLAQRRLTRSDQRETLAHLYLGPRFDEREVKAVLDNCKTIYRYMSSDRHLIAETVQLLQSGKIVAWYQGEVEFGHRALGHRSILASPFSPYVTENLNRFVKHREDFHPFALSVPAESASALFEASANCRFMASVGELQDAAPELRQFAFNGRTVRVHLVERHVNPRFWSLLEEFGKAGAPPVLVNTSFNLFGEPLVCDPRDAVRSFYCSGIDALALENFLVVKP